MRASDSDRERIVEQLRKHAADGRITMDEFEERMAAAYEAKTYGALSELTRDLPVDLSSSGSGRPEPGGRGGGRSGLGSFPNRLADLADAGPGTAIDWRTSRHELRHQLRRQMLQQSRGGPMAGRGREAVGLAALAAGWAGISVLLTGLWLIAGIADHGHFGDFWPAWPIGIMGLLTLVKGIRFFGDGR
jgi:Domain of unknown function (DUF1707)